MLTPMLAMALVMLLSARPSCDAQIRWAWPASTFGSVNEGTLVVRAIAWVSPKRDAFLLELAESRVFIGRAPKSPEVVNVEGWTKQQTELQLPLAQGGMELNPTGGTVKGCDTPQKGIDLGGPIAGRVPIDARSGWRFEIRDRAMNQVLQRF
jgi:hypothetical protein